MKKCDTCGRTMNYHPHVIIDGIEIDEEIAPLIELIWNLGLRTSNSCQDNPAGMVWIEFAAEDAAEFLNIVAGDYDDEMEGLYNRIRYAWRPESDEEEAAIGWWKFSVLPHDDSVMDVWLDEDTFEEKPITKERDFHFSIGVRFPRTDLETVIQRMRKVQ